MSEPVGDKRSGIGIGKVSLLRTAGAAALLLLVFFMMVTADVYPCKYTDADTTAYAGYGHHSLTSVLANDFLWQEDDVPNRYTKYGGDGPYIVHAPAWTAALYVPIFLGVILFVWWSIKFTAKLVPRRDGTHG